MSMILMVKAMQTKVGNPLRKLVLIKLADNANDAGECWPSYQHIADQCEISRSTVKVHVRELERAGLLRREFRRNGEMNQSNVFHLTLDGGAVAALGGAGKNLGGAGAALGGGAGAAPITSNSFEPVKEPVIESKDIKRQAAKFTPPTVGQVDEYMQSICKGSYDLAEKFVDHYTANGWKVGKNPMKDWQATVRNWIRNSNNFTPKKSTGFTVDQARPQIMGFLND